MRILIQKFGGTALGSLERIRNIHTALGGALSAVVRAGVSPMFASHDRDSRISIMLKPDQIHQVVGPLHDCFMNASGRIASRALAKSVVAQSR